MHTHSITYAKAQEFRSFRCRRSLELLPKIILPGRHTHTHTRDVARKGRESFPHCPSQVIAQQFELVGCDLAAESSEKSVLAIDFVIEHTKFLNFNSARSTEHVRTQFK